MGRRSEKSPTSLVIFACVVGLVVLVGCVVGPAARASRTASEADVRGEVLGVLLPGSTATVALTVSFPSAQDRPVDRVVLEKIETDPDHSSCPTAIEGPDATFSMPPVALGDAGKSDSGVVAATGRLTMNDTGVDQDACRGAKIKLIFQVR